MDKRNGRRGWNLMLGALACALALGAGCKQQTDPPAPTASQAQPAETPTPTTAPTTATAAATRPAVSSAVVATTRLGQITQADLLAYGQTGICPPLRGVTADQIAAGLPEERLKEAVEWIASRQEAHEEVAQRKDPALTSHVTGGLDQMRDQLLIAYVVRTQIHDRLTSPTEADIQDFYNKNKPLFHSPFAAGIRMLLLQTYEPYVVRQGDTLESIAQAVSGDAAKADAIRADVDGRPPRREPDKEFKPLYEGEKLLVPMSPARQAEVKARLESLVADLNKTSSTKEIEQKFLELVRKHDESGLKGEVISPVPTGTLQDKAPLTEIVAATKATGIGHVSPVFQTRHGFQVVFVAGKSEERFHSPEEPQVREVIVEEVNKKRVNTLAEEFMNSLLDDPNLKVDYGKIAQGNQLSTETVVATLGNQQCRWNDMVGAWEGGGRPTEHERIRRLLPQVQPFMLMLFRNHLAPQMNDSNSDLARQLTALRVGYVGTSLIEKTSSEEVIKRIDRERAQAFYEQHKADFTTPAKVIIAMAIKVLPPSERELPLDTRAGALEALLKSMREDMAKVASVQDFMNVKALLDEKLNAEGLTPPNTEEPTPLDELTQNVQAALANLQPDKWSEPFIMDDRQSVATVLLKERTEAGTEPLDKVIDQINKELFTQDVQETLKRYTADYARRAEAKLVD